jgi:uncharacterized protein YecE (DUF72 family)
MAEILLGTQGWSYPDWVGPFYPPTARQSDFLGLYSQSFQTVEIDSTFYAVPRANIVDSWRRNTPASFRFAAKLPQTITHEKRLAGAERELGDFLAVMTRLDERLGPVLTQCPPAFQYGPVEHAALVEFLNLLPASVEFAIEFRHRSWLRPEVYELLRAHRVAWCVIDLYYMPRLIQVTADFIYLRWLGDRRPIKRFNAIQVDRDAATDGWTEIIRAHSSKASRIYGYYSDQYAGHSPASVRLLQRKLLLPESPPPARGLFDL